MPFTNLRGSFGYKDNVALSRFQPEGSAFFNSELEFFLMRLPKNGTEGTFFFEAEDRRYFSSKSVDHETLVLSQAEIKHELGSGWSIGGALSYNYQDLVTDLSDVQTNAVLQVLGHTLELWPFIRKEFNESTWVELRIKGSANYYAAPVDDYWEPGPRVTFGYALSEKNKLRLTYEYLERIYQNEMQIDSDGFALPGTLLRLHQNIVELRFDRTWDEKKRWRTSSRIGLNRSVDNGSGYWNYWLYSTSQSLTYKTSKWLANVKGRFTYYDYENQQAATNDTSHRSKTGIALTGRGERQLSKSIRLFATCDYERSLSNQIFNEYTATTFSGGLDWEF
jgi:hypothetical protein